MRPGAGGAREKSLPFGVVSSASWQNYPLLSFQQNAALSILTHHMMEESLHGWNSDPGDRRPGFYPSRKPRQKALTERLARKTSDPRLLSCGLEPGVRRSNGPLQRSSTRIPELQ